MGCLEFLRVEQDIHKLYCEDSENGIALYSWVHPELVEFVSRAIAADAYDCLVWAEKLESRLKLKA
jgi:hypothetical protein